MKKKFCPQRLFLPVRFAPVFIDLVFKTFLLVLLLQVLHVAALSQDLLWLKQMAGASPNDSSPNDIAVDNSGNVYTVGNFRGVINFGGTVSTAAGRDIFFAKYNSAGSLLWVKRVGATNGFCSPTGVALYKDASNNVFLYISGYFGSSTGSIISVNFNPSGSNLLTMNDTQGDAFIAKYTSNGDYVWAKRIDNTRGDFASGGRIATDGSGNAYIAATDSFSGGFLRKFDINGNPVWVNTIGSNANDIAFRSNNIYVCGYNLANSRPIAWYNSSGGLVNSTGATNRNFLRLTLDGANGIFAIGSIANTVQDDVSIEKYTTTTSSTPAWSRYFLSSISGFSGDITYEGNLGNIMVTGWFRGTVDFNAPGGVSKILSSSGSGSDDNIFVARYFASNGNVDWVKNNTSNTSTGQSNPIAIATNNNSIHVLGFVLNRIVNAAFCGTAQNINAITSGNAYLATYHQVVAPTFISVNDVDCPEYVFFTNLYTGYTYNWQYYELPNGPITTLNNVGYQQKLVLQNNRSYSVGVSINTGCGATNWFYITENTNCTGGGHLMAYPNPTSTDLFVDSRDSKNGELMDVTVVSDRGHSVIKQAQSEAGKMKIDMSKLEKGVYILDVKKGDEFYQERISKQ